MASFSATRARWANSAPCQSSAATFAAETNFAPAAREILYNEYNFVAAFAVSSLLALLALLTLVLKSLVEWQHARARPTEITS